VTAAVFFDVDFTLIYPGPRFQATGYHDFCARRGIDVDQAKFDRAVAEAASGLDSGDDIYDPQLYVDYTRRIIEGMGGRGPSVEVVAREIYDEWAACSHFTMYDDVPDVLRGLHASGLKIGLISNHTGIDRERNATIDLLKNASGVELKALFSPEHGIRGEVDERVDDTVDQKTGLPVYSLYGVLRAPTPAQLRDLDALVYDI